MEITYAFRFESGRTETFALRFRDEDFALEPLGAEGAPWTRLEHHRCEGCPLSAEAHPHCPVALNLAHILPRFHADHSYDRVTVTTAVPERTTVHEGDLQTGITSVMGLVMATSGCPVLDAYKPMAFTHLPFANERETTIRSVSTYLTAQYVRMCHGLEPDWTLSRYLPRYEAVKAVNTAFAERLKSAFDTDASLNALILLDVLAQFGAVALKDRWLKDVEPLFGAHLKD
jgi:hypothetical protein